MINWAEKQTQQGVSGRCTHRPARAAAPPQPSATCSLYASLSRPSSSCRCLELLDRLPQLYPQHRKVTCIGYAAHCPRACPPAVSCRGPTCSSHHLQPWLVECSQQWTQPTRDRGRPTEKEANRQGQRLAASGRGGHWQKQAHSQ